MPRDLTFRSLLINTDFIKNILKFFCVSKGGKDEFIQSTVPLLRSTLVYIINHPATVITEEFMPYIPTERASQVAQVPKNPPANAGDLRDMGLIPGSGRSPGGEKGNPLQYSCLENSMDRGAWWATVDRVTKSQK